MRQLALAITHQCSARKIAHTAAPRVFERRFVDV